MLPLVIMICIAKLLGVNPKPPQSPLPVTPNVLCLGEALNRSAPLARLGELMRDSKARFAAILPCVPAGLAPHIRPGPVDDDGWSLLAANAAVAAKLRQLQPRLEEQLREQGWRIIAIRVKVQSPGA